MAISKVKNYNISPYFDDFDETKNYHRILFRPGYAVQARELTQLQTNLQAQIDKMGQHSFKDGSRVLGGHVNLKANYDYVKLTSTTNLAAFVGYTITGGTTGVTALVKEVVTATGSDADTLYVEYTGSGTNNATTVFQAGEAISATVAGNATKNATIAASGTTPIGKGTGVQIDEGVYFLAGSMVYVPKQSLLLSKYSDDYSGSVVLAITETVVDSGDTGHTALADNATGYTNFAAPGANRYVITATLAKDNLELSTSDTYSNKVVLLQVINGKPKVDTLDDKTGTELSDRLAKRTHEESGDYVVRPFILDIRDNAGGDASKFDISIDPSIAYVRGTRVDLQQPEVITVTKPRSATDDTQYENAISQGLSVGNYVKVAAANITGIPDIENFKTVQLRNSSNSVIGTARVRGINYVSASEVRIYLFDIDMGANSFSLVTNMLQGPVANSGTNFTATSVTPTRYDTGNNGLVFKLPKDAAKTLKDGSNIETVYQIRRRATGTLDSNDQLSVSITDGALASTTDIVATIAGNAPATNFQSVTNNTTSFVVDCTGMSGATNGAEIQIAYSVTRSGNSNSKLKSKTNTTASALTLTANGSASYKLGKADIISLTSIVDANGTDVLHKFDLDNGQRDNFYDEGSIVLKSGESVPNGNLVVNFKYYSHGAGDYFTVDSYPSADYATIPTFDGIGGRVELRDCVDFRPTKGQGSPTAGNEFATGSAADLTGCPVPGASMTNDITYYLPRLDKLYVTKQGEFKIVEGVSAANPKAPEDPDDAMILYSIRVNPYVYKLSDVKPKLVNNKRYTMSDIGKLDKRIKNLEYYTSLSLLEKQASDTSIQDGSSNERFKNGILVDGFYGQGVSNTLHPDNNWAVDRANGVLRAKTSNKAVNLVRKASEADGTTSNNLVKLHNSFHSGSSGPKYSGGIATLPYTETSFITQPYSTYAEWVNPYNVFTWTGELKLSPESDEWKETDVRPDVIINDDSHYDQLVNALEGSGVVGTVWNEWETNWSGSEITDTSTTTQEFTEGRATTTVTTTTNTITTTSSQTRSGTTTTVVPDSVTKELGNRVVEVNFVPFIRSRKIYFHAERMKPNTKVYAFFDNTNVTTWCNDADSFQEFSAQTDVTVYGPDQTSNNAGGDLITSASGEITGSFLIPRTSSLAFKTGAKLFRLTDSSTNNSTDETTNAEATYHAQGLLETSENVIVSTKVPTLVRSEARDGRVVTATHQNSTSTQSTTWEDPLAQTILCTDPGGVFVSSISLYFNAQDASKPCNVSIRSVQNGFPTQNILPGASVNIYPSTNGDATKQKVAGISNDASTATTVKFDHPVYLAEDQEYAIVLTAMSDAFKVFVAEIGGFDLTDTSYRVAKQPYNGVFFKSANASTWTPDQTKDLKFVLNKCVFDTDPCTLTLTNDVVQKETLPSNPFAYLSKDGDSTKIRVKHPNHGMYSQDANAHKVTISGQSGTINGITAANMNGTHILLANETTHDSYVIDVTGAATSVAVDGSIVGGGNAIRVAGDRIYNTLYPFIQNIQVPGTAISWFLTGKGGCSQDGSETPYQTIAETRVLANNNNTFTKPWVIASADNETYKLSGNKSFEMRCVMTNGGNANLSPVIDVNRASAICIQNRINNSSAATNTSLYSGMSGNYEYVADTVAKNSTSMSKYVTKKVELAEEAAVVDVYLNANRPDGSSIDLYYKVLGGGSDLVFDDQPWVLADNSAAETTVEPSIIPYENSNKYSEVHYSIDPAGGNFGSFAFKIVLRSTNSSNIPSVKDFRVIASI